MLTLNTDIHVWIFYYARFFSSLMIRTNVSLQHCLSAGLSVGLSVAQSVFLRLMVSLMELGRPLLDITHFLKRKSTTTKCFSSNCPVADKLTAGKAALPIFVISNIWRTTKTDHSVMKHLWQVKVRLNNPARVLIWYERCYQCDLDS